MACLLLDLPGRRTSSRSGGYKARSQAVAGILSGIQPDLLDASLYDGRHREP
jgi:hypothetical protein